MKKISELNDAHNALTLWANKDSYMEILGQSGGLGYSTRTQEGKWMIDGGILPSMPPKSVCPEIKIDPRLSATIRVVQDAYESLPNILQVIIKIKYKSGGLEAEKIQTYQRITGRKKRAYYSDLDIALGWVAARLITKAHNRA